MVWFGLVCGAHLPRWVRPQRRTGPVSTGNRVERQRHDSESEAVCLRGGWVPQGLRARTCGKRWMLAKTGTGAIIKVNGQMQTRWVVNILSLGFRVLVPWWKGM